MRAEDKDRLRHLEAECLNRLAEEMKWLKAFGAALTREGRQDLAVRVSLPLYSDAVPTGMLPRALRAVVDGLMQCPDGPGGRRERLRMADRISFEAERLYRWQISGEDSET